MNRFRLSLLAFFLYSISSGQNLVPNGGFEEGVEDCPIFIGGFNDECALWYSSISSHPDSLESSPDWFHECSEEDVLSPPEISFGTQIPFEGSGYAGLVAFAAPLEDFREIIGVELIEPLSIGQSYLVQFRYSLTSTPGNAIWCNNLGFNFSTHQNYLASEFPINQSHFSIDSIIPESNEWSTVSQIFTADSAYTFFHIGNFYDDNNTATLFDGFSSYFLIDEVSISETLSSSMSDLKNFCSVFPNPTRDHLSVTFSVATRMSYRVVNMQGVVLLNRSHQAPQERFSIDLNKLKPGYHILEIITPKTSFHETIIKI